MHEFRGQLFSCFSLEEKTVFVCSHYLIRMYVLVSENENDSDLLHFFEQKILLGGWGCVSLLLVFKKSCFFDA